MGTTDPRVDAYIEKAADFAKPMLERVRKAFHKGCPDVVETIKWSMPFFEHAGPLGYMAAFKKHASFGFWRAKELPDPEELFVDVGKMQMGMNKVYSLKELSTQAVIVGYVKRAAKHNERLTADKAAAKKSGKKVAKKKARVASPKVPADLAAALKKSKRAKATYDSFPPSAKRDYVEWITGAKREATRKKRLATAIEWMAEGKRRNWKYEKC